MTKEKKGNYPSFSKELGLKEINPKQRESIQKKAINGELSGNELVAGSYDTHE
jgi:hypothetical protein